jgi:hypothetical protein
LGASRRGPRTKNNKGNDKQHAGKNADDEKDHGEDDLGGTEGPAATGRPAQLDLPAPDGTATPAVDGEAQPDDGPAADEEAAG